MIGQTTIDLEDRLLGNYRRITNISLGMHMDKLKKEIHKLKRMDKVGPELTKLQGQLQEMSKL
jgi:hypothetical protein